MNLKFRHYIWGMLQTANGQAVAGRERVVARTPDVTDDMCSRVFRLAMVNLKASVLGDNNAFAFFPLGSGDYIVSRYQVSPLSEPRSRGKPVFVHYIWVEEIQLEQLKWNLVPLFTLFRPIGVYSVVEEQPHLELELSRAHKLNNKWFQALRTNIPLVQSVLVHLLSTNDRISITSGPNQQEQRLRWLCGLVRCLPRDLRCLLSFCTLADPTASSARVVFSSRHSPSVVSIDWRSSPKISGPGSVFAAWIDEVACDSPKAFRDEVDLLRLPHREDKPVSLASQLDLAVEFGRWTWTPAEIMQAGRVGLDQITTDIRKYRPILTNEEVVEWLGMVLARAIILSEFDLAGENVTQHIRLFGHTKTRQGIIERILEEVLRQEHIGQLAQFILRLDALSRKNPHLAAGQFAEDIVLACLERDLDQGITLWKELAGKSWGKSPESATKVLRSLHYVEPDLLPKLIDAILESIDVETLVALQELLERSESDMIKRYPQTYALLKCFGHSRKDPQSDSVLDYLAGSSREVKNPSWFVVSTKASLEELPIESLSSSAFIQACVEFLRLHANQPVGTTLCNVLTKDPKLVYASSHGYLVDLLDASLEYGAGQLAALCFVAIMKHLLPNGGLNEALFAPYQSRLLSMNPAEVLDQIEREYPPVEKMSLGDLRQWMDFVKELLVAEGTDAGPRLRIYAMYVETLQLAARKRRCCDVEDLAVAFPMSEGRTAGNLSDALVRLTDEIVRSGDLEAWIHLSQQIGQTQSSRLTTEYRESVNRACRSISADETDFAYYLRAWLRLHNSGFPWEAGVLVCMLLQFPEVGALRELAIPLASTILDMQNDGISLAELGAWVDTDIWLVEAEARNFVCHTLVAQDRNMAQETLAACSTLTDETNRGSMNPLEPEMVSPECKGASFAYGIAKALERELRK